MAIDLGFSIQGWSAWAPGLSSESAWRAWAEAPWRPQGEGVAELPQLPAMLRRRLDRLGRAVLHAALGAAGEAAGELPAVFVSARGDALRSYELLAALSRGEPLSPASFGLSVHNAIAAQWSMARRDRSGYTALAAGREGVEQGLIEAVGRLADGAGQVLLVAFEDAVPAAFADFSDEPDPLFAWAWRIAPVSAAGQRLRLRLEPRLADGGDDAAELPQALQIFRDWLAERPEWHSGAGDGRWRWSRCD